MRQHEVPMWNTEEQDMMADAQAWVAKQADDALRLADDIVDGLNRPALYWRPDDAMEVEELRQRLEEVHRLMVRYGFISKGPV